MFLTQLRRLSLGFTVSLLLLITSPLVAQQAQLALSEAIVDASRQFIGSLDTAQREQATYEFGSEERINWHFIPRAR